MSAPTSVIGTFRTCQDGPPMSVPGGKADLAVARSDFRFLTQRRLEPYVGANPLPRLF
jgi:hypothetical protein